MKRILFVFFFLFSMSFNLVEVNALYDNLTDEQLDSFYDYYVYEDGYRVILDSKFESVLNSSSTEYNIGDFVWTKGEPIPNPAPNGLYNEKPVRSLFSLFDDVRMEHLDLSTFDTSNVTIMNLMFSDCENLKTVDLSSFDTSNVENMYGMFSHCKSIETLDLSHFDTSKVSDMGFMFRSCYKLNDLNISTFDTSNVVNMQSMFQSSGIRNLDLTHFNTENVTDMGYIFASLHDISGIDFSGFNTSKVTDMSGMFHLDKLNYTLDLSHFNTESVTDMSDMFNYGSFKNINLSNFNTSNVTDMSDMFNKTELTDGVFDISGFDTSKVTDMSGMFRSSPFTCELDLSHFNTSNVTNMAFMFDNSNFSSVNLSSFDTSNVIDMSWMFNDSKLSSINLSNFDTSKVNYMNNTFSDCQNLEFLDVSNLNTSSVTNMESMFMNNEFVNGIDLSNFDTSNVETMQEMFRGSDSPVLNLSNFNTSKVTNMKDMFYLNWNLKHLDLSNFDTSSVTTMKGMFEGCFGLIDLDVSSFNTENVTTMKDMFGNSRKLNEIDVSSFNTSNVNDMSGMFQHSYVLENLDLSNFNTASVTDMSLMFTDCVGLKDLDVTSFDINNVTDMAGMFMNCVNLNELDLSSFDITASTPIDYMFDISYLAKAPYEEGKFINGYAKNEQAASYLNDSSVTGINTKHISFEDTNKQYTGNINSELIDLQIFPINDGTGDYAISGKVVVVEWVDGDSTVPRFAPIMSFKGEYGDKLDVFVTAEGTNTYYFDRRISSEGLVDGQDFRFEITSGNPNNISDNKSMYLYLSTSPNVEHEKSFRISDTKSISYKIDTNGQLVIFNEDDPYDYIGNINSELINLDVVPVNDGTGDVVITGEVIVVEWVNADDPMGDPNVNGVSTVPIDTPIMNFVAADGSESISVFVTPMGTNTFYFDRRISGEGLTEGKTFNFNIKSGNERNLSQYNNVNLYLSTSTGVEKTREFTLPSGKILQYYENDIGELELSNKDIE